MLDLGRFLGLLLSVALLVLACGGDDQAVPASDAGATATSSTASSQQEDQLAGEPESTTTTVPVVGVEELGFPPEIAECVQKRAGGEEVAAGEVVTGCVRAGPMASGFVDGLMADFPGAYSTVELACLAMGYGELSSEDVGFLVSSALDPEGDHPDAEAITWDLFAGCGTEPPSP